MKYHNITHDDMLNGDGLRVVLWVAGCDHRCEGCQNPITWDCNTGLEFDDNAKTEIFNDLRKDYIAGITFSGGDPLQINNRECIGKICQEIKENFPDKTIWLYTGYKWEQINKIEFIKYIDIIVDGRFIEKFKDTTLRWKGSSNQRVIDVQKSIKNQELTLYD